MFILYTCKKSMYINSPNKHANRLKPQTRKNTLSFSFRLTPPNFDSCAITSPVSDLWCHHWCRCLAPPPDPTISKICYLLHTPNARCAYSPGRGLGRWPRLVFLQIKITTNCFGDVRHLGNLKARFVPDQTRKLCREDWDRATGWTRPSAQSLARVF